MNALNRVELIGNLGQDPEVRYLENGVAVARFSLATTERYRDNAGNWQDRPTEWHEIVCWRYLAERAEKELKQGKSVYVVGSINYRSYEDQNGVKRKSTSITAKGFRVFERRESTGGSFPTAADDPFAKTTTNTPPAPKPTPQPMAKTEAPVDEIGDDLPF